MTPKQLRIQMVMHCKNMMVILTQDVVFSVALLLWLSLINVNVTISGQVSYSKCTYVVVVSI